MYCLQFFNLPQLGEGSELWSFIVSKLMQILLRPSYLGCPRQSYR